MSVLVGREEDEALHHHCKCYWTPQKAESLESVCTVSSFPELSVLEARESWKERPSHEICGVSIPSQKYHKKSLSWGDPRSDQEIQSDERARKIQMWPLSALLDSEKPSSPLWSTDLSGIFLKRISPSCLPAIIKSDPHIKAVCVCMSACMKKVASRSLSVIFLLADEELNSLPHSVRAVAQTAALGEALAFLLVGKSCISE